MCFVYGLKIVVFTIVLIMMLISILVTQQTKTLSRKAVIQVWWNPWALVLQKSQYSSTTYFKYLLSIWTNWHILEERIIFFVFFIWLGLIK